MLQLAAKAAAAVDTSAILISELQGKKIGEAIRQLRITAVAEVISTCKPL
jgi:hypothetical protein